MTQFKLKASIGENVPLLGMMMFSGCAILVEMLGFAGFDFVILDMEHSAHTTTASLQELVRAANGAQLGVLVRVPSHDSNVIRSVMETGVDGIIVPHVQSRAEALFAVASVRFPPAGIRGYAGASVRAASFGLGPSGEDFIRQTNSDALVIVMAEDALFFQNMEEILAVDGIAGVFFGTSDYAVSQGLAPGRPETVEQCAMAQRTLTQAAVRRGLLSMAMARKNDAAAFQELVSDGHQLLIAGSDISHFASTARASVAAATGFRVAPKI